MSEISEDDEAARVPAFSRFESVARPGDIVDPPRPNAASPRKAAVPTPSARPTDAGEDDNPLLDPSLWRDQDDLDELNAVFQGAPAKAAANGADDLDDGWISPKATPTAGAEDLDDGWSTPKATSAPSSDEYSKMPWSQVGLQALKSTPGSASNTVANIAGAVFHPIRTAEGLASAGSGLASQAKGWLGYRQDPKQKAQDEAVINALEEHFGQYGSSAGWKKAIATDPVGTALDISTPLTLGESALGSVPGALGKAASIAGKVGEATDPVRAALRIAAAPVKAVTPAVQSVATGAPASAFKLATSAGATTDDASRLAFNNAMTGATPPSATVDKVNAAISAIAKDRRDQYVADALKNGVKGAAPGALPDLDWAPVVAAYKNATQMIKTNYPTPERVAISNNLNDIGRNIVKGMNAPSGSEMRTMPGFDDLKRSLGEYLGSNSPTVQDAAVKPIRDAIVQSITAQHPGYSEMMQNYANASDALKDMRSMAGSAKMAPAKQFAKIFNTYKKGARSNLVEQLAAKDPTLPYELAGHALHEWTPGGLRNIIEGSTGVLGAFHDPSSIPSIVGAAAASSPRLMGNINYAAGAVSKRLPSTKSTSRLATGVNDTQARDARAAGGPVKRKKTHEELVARLMSLAEEAKSAAKRDTEKTLALPDDLVAKALTVANKAI